MKTKVTLGDLKLEEVQVKEFISNLTNQIGIDQALKLVFETVMYNERMIFNSENGTVSNGFRSRKIFASGKIIEL
jgi:hypothetical protein